MQTQPQITFKGLEPSPALRELVEHQIAQLERHHPRITSCRVVIEEPHRHHQHGNHWHIKVVVGVPADEIVVNREPERSSRHEDPFAAVRDAFDTMKRRLESHARKVREEGRHEVPAPAARIGALAADHGFITTEDGRQLYFHAHAVLGGTFDALQVGARVDFVEEDGVEGPQASTVRVV